MIARLTIVTKKSAAYCKLRLLKTLTRIPKPATPIKVPIMVNAKRCLVLSDK